MNTISQIEELRNRQLEFYYSGKTKQIEFRKESLRRLKQSIINHEKDIKEALREDLNKSSFEAYATEIGIVLHELRTQLHNLSRWSMAKPVVTPAFALPSRSFIVPEPYGRVFIISPWNYPFQLPMVPLIGAISAGNVAIIRQSRNSPATNRIISKILKEALPEEQASVIECDLETAEAALKMKWEMIFFTGSTEVGRKIYTEAAKNLTPVILELGGKCPVIVDDGEIVEIAARRIIWGKLINAGQTCISPDFLFVNEKIKERLVECLKAEITRMYGNNPIENPEYPRLVSEKAFDRIISYVEPGKILHGGKSMREKLCVEPTIIEARLGDKCMSEEIFGPVFPVVAYSDLEEVYRYFRASEKPLAIYFFSRDRKKQKRMINETESGACLINDVVLHIANKHMPFGGVGESGMGRYHGKESFRAFSNLKAVMKSSTLIDIPIKYAPFGKKERIIKWFLR